MRVGIIGAGISGLYLAWKLSEKRHNVVVFERKSEIGNDACSGLFSERILDFIPQSEALVKNKINYVFIHFPKKTVRIDFSKKFYVMNHAELDKLVFSLAKQSGADIILKHGIKEIPEGFDKIIGADGPDSLVRKSLNLAKANCRLGILGFVDNEEACADFVETWPVRGGFIWKIPRGKNVEYGVLAPQKQARADLERFLKDNNIALRGVRAKIVPQGFLLPKNDSVTLVGDAAGLTKPWSGGGVIWQLSLADILLKSFPDFKEYRKEAYLNLGFRNLIGKIGVSFIYFLGFNLPFLLPGRSKMESDFLIRK